MAHDDILVRIEDVVAKWSTEVTEAQEGLSDRLANVRERLDTVAAGHAARTVERAALADAEATVEALKEMVSLREDDLRTAAERSTRLEQQMADLSAQVERLEAGQSGQVEDLLGPLAQVESDGDALAQLTAHYEQDALAGATRIEELETQAATLAGDLATLQAQLQNDAEVHESREEELEALHAELAQARERLAQAEAHGAEQAEATVNASDYERIADEAAALREELAQANEQALELRRQLAAHPPLGELEDLQRVLEQERQRADLLEGQLYQPRDDADRVALREQLAGALRDRDEAHQEIVSLRSEVDMLRRANAGLTIPAEPDGAKTETLPIERLGADGHKRRMGEILIELGVITPEQLQEALDEQALTPQRRLGAILVECGYTTEDVVARVLARQLDLPFVRLTEEVVDDAAPRIITAQLAKRRMCIPITVAPDRIVLSMANPFDLVAIEDVERTIDRRVDPAVTTPSDIASALLRYYETT